MSFLSQIKKGTAPQTLDAVVSDNESPTVPLINNSSYNDGAHIETNGEEPSITTVIHHNTLTQDKPTVNTQYMQTKGNKPAPCLLMCPVNQV